MKDKILYYMQKYFDKKPVNQTILETPRQREIRLLSYKALPITAFVIANNTMVIGDVTHAHVPE